MYWLMGIDKISLPNRRNHLRFHYVKVLSVTLDQCANLYHDNIMTLFCKVSLLPLLILLIPMCHEKISTLSFMYTYYACVWFI